MKNVLLLVLSLVVTVALVEVGLRIADWPKPGVYGWKSSCPPPERNQLGFRGKRIEAGDLAPTVVLLGDSQVEARSGAVASMPENILAEHLNDMFPNTQVYSLGCGGYGQGQQLLALRQYFKEYRADLVVLWITFFNDVSDNLFPVHVGGKPKPTFWLENGQLKGPNVPMEGAYPFKINALIAQAVDPIQNVLAHVPMQGDKSTACAEGEDVFALDATFNNAKAFRSKMESGQSGLVLALETSDERLQYGLKLTKMLINDIAKECAEHNAKLVLFYPDPPAADYKLSKNIGAVMVGNVYDRPTVFSMDGACYPTSLRAANERFDFITTGHKVFRYALNGSGYVVSEQDPHLNERGNREVISALASWLKAQSPPLLHN